MKKQLKKIVPKKVINLLRKIISSRSPKTHQEQLFHIFDQLLQNDAINAVDVGGANGLQPHWMRMYHNLRVLIFEPGNDWYQKLLVIFSEKIAEKRFIVSPKGLSETGGERILYLTNIPTGSSLLKPNASSDHVKNSEYYNPYKEITVSTITFDQALKDYDFPSPDLVKLDVQGLELSILKSISGEIFQNVLLYELEINLTDAYEKQNTLEEYLTFFDKRGYELLDLRTNRGSLPIDGTNTYYEEALGAIADYAPSIARRLYEVDALFIPKIKNILKLRNAKRIRKMILLLIVFNFFHDALFLLKRAVAENIMSAQDEADIIKLLRSTHEISKEETSLFNKILEKQKGVLWAQYTPAVYPSF